MKDIHFDFVDLDSTESFELFGKSLGGVLQNNTLHFDNNIAKVELVKAHLIMDYGYVNGNLLS